MDMLRLPVSTLAEPVSISGTESKTIKFEIDQKIMKLITKEKSSPFFVEVRGLALNSDSFKNAWPHFGELNLNSKEYKRNFTLPNMQMSRKRKDDPINLTQYFLNGKSHVLKI